MLEKTEMSLKGKKGKGVYSC